MDDQDKRGMVKDMTEAAATKRTAHGVKGPSPPLNEPGFNVVWSFYQDYMHSALLGVTRQYAKERFSAVGEEFLHWTAFTEIYYK